MCDYCIFTFNKYIIYYYYYYLFSVKVRGNEYWLLNGAFEWGGFDMLLRCWHDVIMVDWEIKQKWWFSLSLYLYDMIEVSYCLLLWNPWLYQNVNTDEHNLGYHHPKVADTKLVQIVSIYSYKSIHWISPPSPHRQATTKNKPKKTKTKTKKNNKSHLIWNPPSLDDGNLGYYHLFNISEICRFLLHLKCGRSWRVRIPVASNQR